MEAVGVSDEEKDPGELVGLLQKYQLQQQEQFEHMLMRHEQRILDSIGSSVSQHCQQACEQAMRRGSPLRRSFMGESSTATEREGRPRERLRSSSHTPGGRVVGVGGTTELGKAEGGRIDMSQLRKAGTACTSTSDLPALTRTGGRYRGTVIDQAQIRDMLLRGNHRTWGWSRATSPARTSLREQMQRLIGSRKFDNLMIALITLNAIVIAVQVDYVVKSPTRVTPAVFRVFDLSFAMMFTIELGLRVFVDRCRFLYPRHARFTWNLLDTFLVLVVIFDEVCQLMSVEALDVSSAKMVRLLRLARIVRVLRLVREFHDLEVMVMGILSSLKSLVWAMVLLGMIVFMFAAVFMEFVTNELINHGVTASTQPLLHNFGTLFQSVYTLFKCISGGIDWDEAASPLVAISPVLGILFCMYVGFSIFCVLNIITAVFVEHAHRVGVGDEEKLVLQALERRQQQVKEVNNMFSTINKSHGGQVAACDFKSHLSDVAIQACFARLGINFDDQETLFELLELDEDVTGVTISVQDLTECIQMVQASASRADVDRLLRESVQLRKQLQDLVEVCQVFAEAGYAHRERKSVPGVQGSALTRSCCLLQPILCPDVVAMSKDAAPFLAPPEPAPAKAAEAEDGAAATAVCSAAEAALRAAAEEVAEVDAVDDAASGCSVQALPLPGFVREGPQLLA